MKFSHILHRFYLFTNSLQKINLITSQIKIIFHYSYCVLINSKNKHLNVHTNTVYVYKKIILFNAFKNIRFKIISTEYPDLIAYLKNVELNEIIQTLIIILPFGEIK